MIYGHPNAPFAELAERCGRCGDSETQNCERCGSLMCSNCTSELLWGLGVCSDPCGIAAVEHQQARIHELRKRVDASARLVGLAGGGYRLAAADSAWRIRWVWTFTALMAVSSGWLGSWMFLR